jgi:hypothetical protein
VGPYWISSEAEWLVFLRACQPQFSEEAPEPDWAQEEVIGYQEHVACPLAEAQLSPLACGRQLEIHFWQKSDFCFCDYYFSDIQFYIVPRGRFDRVVRVIHQEPKCHEVMCDCGEYFLNGCDVGFATGFCGITVDGRATVDNQPPPWPPALACPSPPSTVP